MLTKCVNCGFYIQQDDEFCLNCGIGHPAQGFSDPPPYSGLLIKTLSLTSFQIFFALLLMLTILFTLADFSFSGIFYLRDYILFWAMMLGFSFSFISTHLLKQWYQNTLNRSRSKTKDNLTSVKKIIDRRLTDLGNRVGRIDVILDRIKQTDSPNLQDTRKKLLAAREVVTGQFARYELQAKKIEIVRLQNRVLPYLNDFHRLNDFETEDGLVEIENTKRDVEKVHRNLSNFYAIELPKAVQPEKESFLSLIRETEDSCDKLREAILSRQAARAMRDISPLEENLAAPTEKDIAHAVETFNIQTTLTDFSESFEQLENEYRRLQAEKEIGQKLL